MEAEPGRPERVRVAEVVGALSLATDLQLALDLEHGLRSAIFAMRLGERLGADRDTLSAAFHGGLLMNVGCTADVHVRAQLFERWTTPSRPGRRHWSSSRAPT